MTRAATAVVFGLLILAAAQRAPARRTRSLEHLATKSKDPLIRETAVQVLGLRGSQRSVPLLVERLAKDDNLWVRARAAEALGRMGATAAIRPLRSALSREKKQRVRRMVAMALVRLGQRVGVEELMWQLKSGTNHAKAEAMAFMVDMFGAPLGQDVKSWWALLSRSGQAYLARRPSGACVLQQLSGESGQRPLLHGKLPTGGWRQVPAVVLHLRPTRAAVTAQDLKAHERLHGKIPDGALLLIHTGWRSPRARKPVTKPGARPPAGPGINLDAARFLLERAPNMLGVGVDTPALDPPLPNGAHPARDLLAGRGLLVLERVGNMDQLLARGTRLLLVDQGKGNGKGGREVLVLGLLP